MSPAIVRWVEVHRPTGCELQLDKIAAGVPTQEVASVAFVFSDGARGARAAFAIRRDLAAYGFGLSPGDLHPQRSSQRIGDASAVLTTTDAFVVDASGPGTFVVWRSDGVFAYVFVGGVASGRAGREALRLAEKQQARILHPTPLAPADRYFVGSL
jgi:hypothetical protein